jgi:hypothetical protein
MRNFSGVKDKLAGSQRGEIDPIAATEPATEGDKAAPKPGRRAGRSEAGLAAS